MTVAIPSYNIQDVNGKKSTKVASKGNTENNEVNTNTNEKIVNQVA